jgi:hypothetical protein
MHPAAARRILRLAFGTTLCLWFSQAVAWPLSFIAPVLAMFILALPLPAPGLKKSIVFVVALVAPMIVGGWVLLPFLEYMRAPGILLVALGLFYTFYYTARGGNPVIGTFMTVGLTLIVTVGSISSEIMIVLVQGLAVCAAIGLIFVHIAHALLPDLPPDPALAGRKKPPPPKPDPSTAGRNALRSLAIVFPMALAFLFMSGSPAYTVVMIKVATMGQQATADHSKAMGRSLLESTLWGGVGAIIAWNVLSIWPSLILYTLLIALAALVYGRWIFQGPAVHPKFQMVSYAFLTMIVILAPAVLDGEGSSGAGTAFWSRFLLFVLIAVYGTVAVRVFDAFWPGKPAEPKAANTAVSSPAN